MGQLEREQRRDRDAGRLALARKSGDASLVLLKNATTTRKDGSTGKLLPIAVPTTGAFKVLVLGFYANNAELLPGRLLGDPGRGRRRPTRSTPYTGIKNAIQAINPAPRSTT